MKKIVPLFLSVIISASLSAQDFTGQWKGEFIDKSTTFAGWGGDRCEYVLEIECRGTRVSGYSYTYFSDGGKRYYTICRLVGKLNKNSKYIEVTEVERTKTNVPITIRNCFQVHKLTYFKSGDEETIEGTWVPAPNQQGDCGFGTTVLSRRLLKRNPALTNPITKKTAPEKPVAKSTPKNSTPPAVKKTPPAATKSNSAGEVSKQGTNTDLEKRAEEKKLPEAVVSNPQNNQPTFTQPETQKLAGRKFEKRNSELIKTIEIDNETITVDLYDNGEIDGDSISLFFNDKLILSHKRLSDKAIRLNLVVDSKREMNELVMYAENLGTIPPNTALMVVYDGDNRYEVRISSDLQKSGVIRFIHKPKNQTIKN